MARRKKRYKKREDMKTNKKQLQEEGREDEDDVGLN
jgi:hypothetical protein